MEFQIALCATLFVGAIICPWSPSYTESELSLIAKLTKPKVVFVSNSGIKNVVKTAAKESYIEHIVAFNETEEIFNTNSKVIYYNSLLNDKKIASTEKFKCALVPDDATVLILVSSGTTGLPKGVEISNLNLRATMEYIHDHGLKMREAVGIVTLSVLPCFHSYGLLTAMSTLITGEPMITLPKFKDTVFLSTIANYKVQAALLFPSTIVFLAKSTLVALYDLSSLKIIRSGAVPLGKETIKTLNGRLPTVEIAQGYGLSETTLRVLSQKEQFNSPGSVGCLTGGIWGKVVDVATGRNVGPNQNGELCFKGPYIMKGYINNKVETDNIIDRNCWFHSGDIGYYKENGEWFIVDRIKEVIKFKGFQVPPAEVESVLLSHSKIVDCGVVGLPDERYGELPLAFVVKKSDEQLTKQDVKEYVSAKLSYAKRLHGGVIFVSTIPRNTSGKILRRLLKGKLKAKSKL